MAVRVSHASYGRTSHRRGADAGFTLAELLFAIVIMVVATFAVLGALSSAATNSLTLSRKAKATEIANERIEQARNMPYRAIGVHFSDGSQGEPPGAILTPEEVDGYLVETAVDWRPVPGSGNTSTTAEYKRIVVTGDVAGDVALARDLDDLGDHDLGD